MIGTVEKWRPGTHFLWQCNHFFDEAFSKFYFCFGRKWIWKSFQIKIKRKRENCWCGKSVGSKTFVMALLFIRFKRFFWEKMREKIKNFFSKKRKTEKERIKIIGSNFHPFEFRPFIRKSEIQMEAPTLSLINDIL